MHTMKISQIQNLYQGFVKPQRRSQADHRLMRAIAEDDGIVGSLVRRDATPTDAETRQCACQAIGFENSERTK
jgi:hypothetical protein